MLLSELALYNFRNLKQVNISFNEGINCIIGANGSGKTSLLEAIYYLSHLKSFRTQQLQRLINYESNSFTLHAKIIDHYQSLQTIGISRILGEEGVTKLSGECKIKASDVAEVLPVLLIHPNSYHFLDHGPKFRRQLMDWGVFHVEHTFFDTWKRYNRLLKQRNAIIRTGADYHLVAPWDVEFCGLANKISNFREVYLNKLIPVVNQLLEKLINLSELSIDYHRGWAKDENIESIIMRSYEKDIERGYSYYGPHRADLVLKIRKHPVHEVLSRGQQKLLIIAIRLAQGLLLKQITGKSCLFLLDDVTAELDVRCRKYVFSLLKEIDAQVFMTLLDSSGYETLKEILDAAMFHVELGSIKRNIREVEFS